GLEKLPHWRSCLPILAPEEPSLSDHLLHDFALIDPAPSFAREHLFSSKRVGDRIDQARDMPPTLGIAGRVDFSKWAAFVKPERLFEEPVLGIGLLGAIHEVEGFLGRGFLCGATLGLRIDQHMIVGRANFPVVWCAIPPLPRDVSDEAVS